MFKEAFEFTDPLNVAAPLYVETPATLTLSKFVCPSTSKSPFASIAPWNVAVPELTLIPLRAVIIPIESTFVTSSYVKTPPTDTLPVAVMFPVTSIPAA